MKNLKSIMAAEPAYNAWCKVRRRMDELKSELATLEPQERKLDFEAGALLGVRPSVVIFRELLLKQSLLAWELHISGKSIREIAKAMNISKEQAAARLRRWRKSLK